MQVAVASVIQFASVSASVTGSPFPYCGVDVVREAAARGPSLSNESTADEYL